MRPRLILLGGTLLWMLVGLLPAALEPQQTTPGTAACTPLQEAAERQRAARREGTVRGTPSPGWTGMSWRGSYTVENGMPVLAAPPEVSQVVCDSPAHRAGLQTGDLIVLVNGSDPGVIGVLAGGPPGRRFELRVRRGTRVLEVSFVSVARPPELMA